MSVIYSQYKTIFFFDNPDTLHEVSDVMEEIEIGEN
jgi:hypothetical protein